MDMASSFLQICSAWTLHRQFPGLTELSKPGQPDLERRIDLRRLGPLAVGDIHGNGMLPFSFLLNLVAGDTIDFRVASGGDNNGDSTGLAVAVDESITRGRNQDWLPH
jgi:hypothetical protein